jgi:uncharacterized heparinase superfamily protein
MTDYGYPLRQAWIKSNHPLALKLAELRERMHAAGQYFVGEEQLAKRNGGKTYNPWSKQWEKKK